VAISVSEGEILVSKRKIGIEESFSTDVILICYALERTFRANFIEKKADLRKRKFIPNITSIDSSNKRFQKMKFSNSKICFEELIYNKKHSPAL